MYTHLSFRATTLDTRSATMATKDTRRRLAPPTPVPGHTLDPSSGDAMPRTVPSLASLGAVSAGIPKEATARPHKGLARYSYTEERMSYNIW